MFFSENLLYRLITIVSVCVAFYVAINQISIPGLEFLFVVPLTYTICSIVYRDVFMYHKNGWGLKVYFVMQFVRFVIGPFLMAKLGDIGYPKNSEVSGYIYAIVVSCIEIITSYVVLHRYYIKEYKRIVTGRQAINYYCTPSFLGFMLFFSLVLLVFVRGHLPEIIQQMRFLVVSTQYDVEDLWSYDIWFIHLIFALTVIYVTSFFQKKNDSKPKIVNIIIPTIIVFLTATIVILNNRMLMVNFALTGLAILGKAFPMRQKFLQGVMISTMLIVAVSFTMMKNYNIDVSSDADEVVTEKQQLRDLQDYTCGVENIAHSFDMYQMNGSKMGIENVLSLIAKHTILFKFPGMGIKVFKDIPTTIDLATTGTEMVSVAGETLFWGTPFFGIFFDIFAIFVIVRILVKMEIYAKTSMNLGIIYICNWLAIIFGFSNCYCIMTLWETASNLPFLLAIALLVNNLTLKKQTICKL